MGHTSTVYQSKKSHTVMAKPLLNTEAEEGQRKLGFLQYILDRMNICKQFVKTWFN